jgi:hypothetical protein
VRVLAVIDLDELEIARVLSEAVGIIDHWPMPAEGSALSVVGEEGHGGARN